VKVIGASRKGSSDGPNEDAIGWDETRSLAFVADGMGGEAKGEVASGLVKETLLEGQPGKDLTLALLEAHGRIQAVARERPDAQGMGSTLVALAIANRTAKIVWVGDSRAYLWRRSRLRPLTRDHSYAEMARVRDGLSEAEVRVHPGHNVITQALGRDTPTPSECTVSLRRYDWLLLCSDGLSGTLLDEQLAELLKTHADLERAVPSLIESAAARGSKDDISVVMVEYDGPSKLGIDWQWGPRTGMWLSILGGVLLALMVGALSRWIQKGR
jgi:serine/threonine protein phosphatase PrpC